MGASPIFMPFFQREQLLRLHACFSAEMGPALEGKNLLLKELLLRLPACFSVKMGPARKGKNLLLEEQILSFKSCPH